MNKLFCFALFLSGLLIALLIVLACMIFVTQDLAPLQSPLPTVINDILLE